ncbi:MAG: hypothetical protein IPI30_22695 [Saprospiraceae bacterium]|nr:hypothetical protein [Candidatus Vicinibacter affinis]
MHSTQARSFCDGLYYNEETGELEGIPVLAITDGFVVLATRHFFRQAFK